MDLAIIIVSWNVRELLHCCLTSINQSLAISARHGVTVTADIWVVDNHSFDGTSEMVRDQFSDVRLIANSENRGFAAANNQAIAQVLLLPDYRHFLLLNPDTLVRGRALEVLVDFMDQSPIAGMAGARLVFGDGAFQHSAFGFPGLAQIALDLFALPPRLHETQLNGRYPRSRYAAHAPPFSVAHPLGAAMIVRREVVETVGSMDQSYFMYCEEIDWAMRIKAAGWKIFCVPAAEIVHYGGQSASQIETLSFVNLWRSRHRLYQKHYPPLKVRLAGQLVRAAMRSRLRRTESPGLQAAYAQVARIWSQT